MVDRSVQYPDRYRFTPVEGQPNVFEITEEPGTIYVAGTVLSAANMESELRLTGGYCANLSTATAYFQWTRYNYRAAGFPFRGRVGLPTLAPIPFKTHNSYIATVVFSLKDAMSGMFAPFCDYNYYEPNIVWIYSRRIIPCDIVIPLVILKPIPGGL